MNGSQIARARRRARQLGFVPELQHRIAVPAGPDGRPGEELQATSRSPYLGVVATDGSRNDCAIMLSPCSWLLVVCFGRVADSGDPIAAANLSISTIVGWGVGTLVEAPVPDVMAGCEAVRYLLELRSGHRLREWKFVREGWLFGAGIRRDLGDTVDVESLAMQVLDTWTWLPGTVQSSNPVPEQLPRISITESVAIRRAPEAVWQLVRPAENARLVVKGVVNAFHVPGTPQGVGEQQCTVIRFPEAEMRQVVEVTEDRPFERLVLRHITPDYGTRTTFELIAVSAGTRLSMNVEYDEPPESPAAKRTHDAYQRSLISSLHRARRLLDGGWPD